MKYTKKLLALFLTVCIILGNSGCSLLSKNENINPTEISTEQQSDINQNNNQTFAEFIDELFRESVASDTVTLHSYLQSPAEYGITDYDITLGRFDLENLDGTKEITECINQLKSFDRSTLSAKQQLTYDQLLKYMETQLEYCDLYMFDTCLSTTIGLQVQLPIIFAEYSFNEEKDVKEYLQILADTDGFFKNVIEYETLRSQNGYFMEDSLVDNIVKQCQTFVDSASDGYLITTFDERIDALSTISDADKATYKEQNKTAVQQHVIEGYKILINGLNGLKGTGKYSGGLCNYPNGKKYYEYLIDNDMGWSKTIDEYDKLLDTYIAKNMLSMQALLLADSTLLDKFDTFKFSITDPNAILEDLKKKIAEDFPTGPSVKCDIQYITKSLQDYASPAMYFTPQLDNYWNNSIYINPLHANDSSLYTTMAHEGYPGHLYQITYFTNSNPDLIRCLIEPGGYVEGWATYCELLSYNYADTGNDALNSMMAANTATVLCLYGKVDIGVNYYGWTVDDILKFMSNYGFDDRTIAEEMYASMVSEPGNYCQYILGNIAFCELKSAAETKLGDKFVLKNFHQYVLDMGPVQFDILFERLDSWVASQK